MNEEVVTGSSGQHKAGLENCMIVYQLAESLPHLVWLARPDGVIDYYNARFLQYLDKTREETEDWSWAEALHPDDRQSCIDAWTEAFTKGKEFFVECLIRQGVDGPYLWHEGRAAPFLDAEGNVLRWVGTCTNIHERKRMEVRLGESVATYRERDILQSVMNGTKNSHLVYLDRDFNFVRVNETYAKNCGYQPEEMIGKNHFTLYPNAENEAIFTRVRDTGETFECHDKPFTFPDQPERGTTYWDWTLAPVMDLRGEVMGLVFSLFETTDRKKNELELSVAKAAAEEASRAKSEFLANISHEIRTPMTIFMAAIEHLLEIDRNPERRHLLNMADLSARRLRNLIDDVLDFAKIEAGRVDIEEVPFDLPDCVKGAVEMFTLPAQAKGIRLQAEVADNVPVKVIGDTGRLGQVLINLIGNAVKFTHNGKIVISVKFRNGFLDFSVSDTGIGIPKEKLDILFESFTQVDASFTRRYGGTGLGLAISKGLVELMGGELSVSSLEGKGSIFTFSLPLKTPEQKCQTPAVASSKEKGGKPFAARILLVEDEPIIRQVITLMLVQKEWQVEIAENGREALKKWESGHFDLILMDLQMPEMDGLTATQVIRNREAGGEKRTVIIGITAHARREIREDCITAGMDSVLTKPIRMDDLFSTIAMFLTES